MINVFSEIGVLKKVLVHTPGKEIEYISPFKLDELLFSNVLEPNTAIEEHKKFVQILKDNGVEVIQLVNLVSETYDFASPKEKDEFLNQWLDEVEPSIDSDQLRKKIKDHILGQKTTKNMIELMMSGFFSSSIGVKSKDELIVHPLPNLFFTRDPFASVGNGVTIHKMKYKTRQRETLFYHFIFNVHPEYKNVEKFTSRNSSTSIEGGDIFVYNDENLVIGVSERTELESIEKIALTLKKNNSKFKRIFAINVPKFPNLMHLDTWLTMIDYNKFLYSPNMLKELKIWEIFLDEKEIIKKELNISLEELLAIVIKQKAILIPVSGKNATQLDIDIETNFDATNYLAIKPGLVVGYDRNSKTEKALKDAGVTVLSFKGNQLSLGMGSARCMSMPLLREPINWKK
ncbi:MAG: arginine deiminase family protein [Mycoplasmoidaceae bacterium]